MVYKILGNENIKKCTITEIKLSKSKKYLLWIFSDNKNTYTGITSSVICYGNKPYMWYSLLVGYFLPPSYTINLDTIINKQCYITVNRKGIVTSVIPIIDNKDKKSKEEELFL